MLERSSYTEPVSACTLVRGDALGYRLALRDWFWFSSQTEVWLGDGDIYPCAGREVIAVDVLPPAQPPEYRNPVFLAEARRSFFARYKTCGKGELLKFLFQCCHIGPQHLRGTPNDNICLLPGQKVALVHWLPGYGCWQLHVRDDLPHLISPGTRIFTLQ